MKIVFLTRFDPKDINNWSGTLYHMYNKLKEKHIIEIVGTEIISQLASFSKYNFQSKSFLSIDRYFEKLNKLLSERINALNCDMVFFGDLYFVPLNIDIPIVILSDMTYEQVKIHLSKTEHDAAKHAACLKFEKLMLDNTDKIIFSTECIFRFKLPPLFRTILTPPFR